MSLASSNRAEKVALACLLGSLLSASPLAGQNDVLPSDEPVLTYGAETDWNSRYVWHGIASSEGAVLQPSAWVSAFGLMLSSWSNVDLGAGESPGGLNELDLTLGWSGAVGGVAIEPALNLYTYPNQVDAPATAELSVGFSLPVGPLTAFTLHEADIASYRSAYLGTAGLSFERDLGSALTLDASAGASWSSAKFNETYVGLGKSGVSLVESSAGLTVRPGGSLYLRPHVELSALLDDELSGMVESPTILSAGFAFGAEF